MGWACSFNGGQTVLTLWSRVLSEKPVVPQLVKKFFEFYGTCMFIT
jgi:hypothetical protein